MKQEKIKNKNEFKTIVCDNRKSIAEWLLDNNWICENKENYNINSKEQL